MAMRTVIDGGSPGPSGSSHVSCQGPVLRTHPGGVFSELPEHTVSGTSGGPPTGQEGPLLFALDRTGGPRRLPLPKDGAVVVVLRDRVVEDIGAMAGPLVDAATSG